MRRLDQRYELLTRNEGRQPQSRWRGVAARVKVRGIDAFQSSSELQSTHREELPAEYETWHLPITYWLVRIAVLTPIRRIWVARVTGLSNIPEKGGAVIALNHQSYFDFLCFAAICPRRIHFLAAEKFFARRSMWRFLMEATGQVRVDRMSAEKSTAKDTVLARLRADRLIGIFPEGTRSNSATMMLPVFTGVANFALEAGVPVIPVGIQGAFEVFPRTRNTPLLKKIIQIHIGQPIIGAAVGPLADDSAQQHMTRAVMQEIAKLSSRQFVGLRSQI